MDCKSDTNSSGSKQTTDTRFIFADQGESNIWSVWDYYMVSVCLCTRWPVTVAMTICLVLARCYQLKVVYLDPDLPQLFLFRPNWGFLSGLLSSGMWVSLSKGQYIQCPLFLYHAVVHTKTLSSFIFMIPRPCSRRSEPQRFPWWQGRLAGAQGLLRCFWWSADCGLALYRSRKSFVFLFGRQIPQRNS